MDEASTSEAREIGQVQACGCIALTESLQQQTGLYPGATYRIEVTEGGAAVVFRVLEPADASGSSLSAVCDHR